jgi:hypothetical protein
VQILDVQISDGKNADVQIPDVQISESDFNYMEFKKGAILISKSSNFQIVFRSIFKFSNQQIFKLT